MAGNDYQGVLSGFNATRPYKIAPEEKDITVIEAMEKRFEMERDILERIQEFETETGLTVNTIDLYANGDDEFTTEVEAQVSL
jgi:arginase family enzyme